MQPLIVLGASARAAAFSAIRAGFAPSAIDLFADQDLASACSVVKIQRYPSGFLTALAAAPNAPWIYTGGLENYPRLVDRLARIRPLWGNRGDVLRQVRSPERLAAAAGDAGCAVPRLGAGGRMLVKPRRSGGGLGIRFARAADLAQPPREAYFQEYVAGKAASAVFVAAGGRAVLLGATRQLMGRDFNLTRPFLYVGSLGPLILDHAETQQLTRLSNMLAVQCGLAGLFNIDFVQANGSVWPVEVNPRYSASVEVLERAGGVAYLPRHAAAYGFKAADIERSRESIAISVHNAGQTLPRSTPHPPASTYCGKAVVYAARAGIVPAEIDPLAAAWNENPRATGLADIPRVGEALHAGQPVVTVLAAGDSLASVEMMLRSRVAEVQSVLQAEA
jgi:uncharacterized protein